MAGTDESEMQTDADIRIELLTRLLDDTWASENAVRKLVEIGGTKVVEPLIKALREDHLGYRGVVRKEAIHALGEIGDARAVEPLINVLKEEFSIQYRKRLDGYCINALCKIDDPRTVELLMKTFDEEDEDLWASPRYAAEALGKIGDPRAIEPLIKMLEENKDGWVRRNVVEILGKVGDSRAVEPLIELLEDEGGYVAGLLLRHLVKLGMRWQLSR